MSANDTQVGGTHYKKSTFQPWDWERYGVGGLEWTAIKHVTRFRDKGGVEDLQKAIHYIDKLIEEAEQHGRCNRRNVPVYELDALHSTYEKEWNLDFYQRSVVAIMVYWYSVRGLEQAKVYIKELINGYSTGDVQPSERVESTTTE